MDLNYLKRLLKIFDESSAHELEIEDEKLKLRMTKQQPVFASAAAISQPVYQNTPIQQHSQAVHFAEPATQTAPAPAPAIAAVEPAEKLHEVRSPIVGTFYRSPAPDQPAYVEVGAKVGVGTVLCIVEAMKLMNEIESDAAGTIVKILVNNAEPVEYNQPLFLVKPD